MILQYIGGALVTGAVTIAVLLLNRLFAKRDKAAEQNTVGELREARFRKEVTLCKQF